MKALTVDGSKWYAFSIDKHSLGGKKGYLLDCMKHFRLSGNGTVILPLPDKNRPPLSSFLPAIFCHIKKGYKFSKVATLFLKKLDCFFLYCSLELKLKNRPEKYLKRELKRFCLSVVSMNLCWSSVSWDLVSQFALFMVKCKIGIEIFVE